MGNRVQAVSSNISHLYEAHRKQQGMEIYNIKTAMVENALDVEAVVFEGGGAKVVAYVGAAEILEEVGMLDPEKGVTKFAGTSGGALVAAMLAMRMPVADIKSIFKRQTKDWILDAWFSYLSFLPNIIRNYGWNPSRKVEEVIREELNSRYDSYLTEHKEKLTQSVERGDRDVTFMDIYKMFNTELCVVSSNLTTRSVQYHHPKTTPDMSVVSALRASISLPLLCQPVNFEEKYLVDGGVMCNYPIHAFDGWFLSMAKEDSYFKRIGTLRTAFQGPNAKTIGFVVNSADENCFISNQLEGVDVSKLNFPDTLLMRKRQKWLNERIDIYKKQSDVRAACDKFLEILRLADTSDDRRISLKEFRTAFKNSDLGIDEFEILFGKGQTIDTVFDSMDINQDGEISFKEFRMSMEQKSVLFKSLLGHSSPEEITGFTSFGYAIIDTISRYSQLVFFKEEDVDRTCRINVWYVNTADFDLEDEDRNFLIEQGRLSCLKYLRKRCEVKDLTQL